MKSIITSRGMGKTTILLTQAKAAADNGDDVFFLVPGKYRAMQLEKEINDSRIIFTTIHDYIFKTIGKRSNNNLKIFIDDIDCCLADLLTTQNIIYTLSIE